MGQTIAEALMAEGAREGELRGALQSSQETLQMLLEKKFGPLPADLVQRITAVTEMARLKAALRQVMDLKALNELQL